jgi:hypothetical protein
MCALEHTLSGDVSIVPKRTMRAEDSPHSSVRLAALFTDKPLLTIKNDYQLQYWVAHRAWQIVIYDLLTY